jgi:hypothetical protein
MRSKLRIAAGGLAVAVALAVPAGAQAAAAPSAPAHAEVTAGPPNDGDCDTMWNEGYGAYAVVSYSGIYPLTLEPLSYWGGNEGAVPGFCNISVTSVNGAFEIEDPDYQNAAGDEAGCLAIDTATNPGSVHDDTPSACYQPKPYPWDEWKATSVSTYHSQTVWEFQNRDNGECLYANGVGHVALYYTCNASYENEWFVWDALP